MVIMSLLRGQGFGDLWGNPDCLCVHVSTCGVCVCVCVHVYQCKVPWLGDESLKSYDTSRAEDGVTLQF